MKEINMTKAISCMPDKFITMEMVELAAAEHRPELVNYLPEKYITSEILDSIFKTDDYGWRSWQLSKIPEEKRNRQICLRAIKAEKSNFPDIPEKYRNSNILESLFAHRNFMHYLHLIPLSSWNNGTVRDAIYSLYHNVQQDNGFRYSPDRYEQQFLTLERTATRRTYSNPNNRQNDAQMFQTGCILQGMGHTLHQGSGYMLA